MTSAISLIGLTISKFMSRFVKLPSMMYVSLSGCFLHVLFCRVKDIVVETTTPVAFLAPATALVLRRYFSGKRSKVFYKNGMEAGYLDHFILVTGTFIFSGFLSSIVLKMTGAI